MPLAFRLPIAVKYCSLVSYLTSLTNRAFAADAVHQNHDAETASEVGGVHHDVGALGRGKLRFGRGFF